ncbi:hypothetical protein ABAC460_02010 [Asticcacaulis sp. AC460]|uniref:DUF4328 domain-containing protein n=1 Tax=Asticcacaulis sp. AC460 TaxID=1282360 RepID=UPI0003C3C002|nr:DUF4328 domain-containing protein [Asticcacaulis sp. AC460]ESQ93052.1 hypothetical protein ABAC460_02010 [Asticcacaulis sp. AC460]
MQAEQGFKSAQGWMIALVIMALLDVAAGAVGLFIGVSGGGWPMSPDKTNENLIVGAVFIVMLLQILLRTASLPMMMRWTWRLVSNAERQARFPMSVRWAWLGWVVPVVSFWLPAKAIMALNDRNLSPGLRRHLVIMTWWCLRLVTTLTGSAVSLFVMLMIAAVNSLHVTADPGAYIARWMFMVVTCGVLSRGLEAVVLITTYRRQPRPGDVVAATVF